MSRRARRKESVSRAARAVLVVQVRTAGGWGRAPPAGNLASWCEMVRNDRNQRSDPGICRRAPPWIGCCGDADWLKAGGWDGGGAAATTKLGLVFLCVDGTCTEAVHNKGPSTMCRCTYMECTQVPGMVRALYKYVQVYMMLVDVRTRCTPMYIYFPHQPCVQLCVHSTVHCYVKHIM